MAASPAVGEVGATAAPTQVELTGVLRVIPAEARPVHMSAHDHAAAEPEIHHEGSVALLTDDGAMVELTDVDAAGLASGQEYTATVDVPADVQVAVEQRVDDLAELSSAEVATAVALAAEGEGVALPVVSAFAEPVVAAAVSPRAHTLDIIAYTENGSGSVAPSASEISAAVGRLSEFWGSQSAGQISSITATSVRSQTVSWDVCDERTAWNNGAAAFGMGSIDNGAYWYGQTSRHLVVLVDENWCGGGGLGTLGTTLYDGGLIHAQIPIASPADWDQVLFHEFGHNITLNHSNVRECTAPKVDSARKSATRQPADPACEDYEYWDTFDVMGGGFISPSGSLATTRNIAALSATQKVKLGALSVANGLQEVKTSGGLLQTYTVEAISATAGTRALQVTDPTNGEKLFVEYRSATGRDANAMYALWSSNEANDDYGPGVRVMRLYEDECIGNCDYYWPGYSLALSRHVTSGVGHTHAMHFRAGEQIKTYTNNVTVRVVSTTATTATVEVGFYTPYTTVPTASSVSVNGGGDPYVGKTLTVNGVGTSAWAPVPTSVNYQWLRNGSAIAGATKSTYQLQGADKGASISVRATPVRPGYRNIAVVSPVVSPAPGGPAPTERISGASRYDTAVKVSERAFPGEEDAAEIVYIATGLNYPDALGAAPSAAYLNGPLLLVPPTGALPASVAAELARLSPERVVIVGGLGAVSEAMADQVADAATVEEGMPPEVDRKRGASRYHTARALVEDAFAAGSVSQVYIATGRNYPDALSASAVAGGKGAPVVLVDGALATLDADTIALLAELKADAGMKAWVIGGTGAVSAGIMSQLSTLGYTPERLSGTSRYETSAKINEQVTGAVSEVFLATGTGYADALAGAVLAGVNGAPLHVTPPTCVSAGAGAQIGANATGTVTLIGGSGALNANVAALGMCP
ncbi:cell wall-binding repeat-containing protein [Microbacterium aoyamense]|nr:cell wall-binding repeat-containing protein [Microbacterium aoyamense]